MGRKIFITYKYGDTGVLQLDNNADTKVRDYVDKLQELLEEGDHINKGELDGESLEAFEDERIASSLRDKIYDSSITIVLISKNMKTPGVSEVYQWMPWEISYSLKEHSRDGRTSLCNAVLAVVLPDENNDYSYYLNYSLECNSRMLNTDFLFGILKKNMFNIKQPKTRQCNGSTLYEGYSSYIHSVEWNKFIADIDASLDIATSINENIDEYTIAKSVKD